MKKLEIKNFFIIENFIKYSYINISDDNNIFFTLRNSHKDMIPLIYYF